MVVIDRVIDGVEPGFVDLRGASMGIRPPLCIGRVTRLLKTHVDELRPSATDPVEEAQRLQTRKRRGVELDGFLVPRDRLVHVA